MEKKTFFKIAVQHSISQGNFVLLFSNFARPCGIIKVSTIVGNESNDIASDLESLVKDVDSGGVVTIRISAAFKFKKDLVVTVILTNGKNRISISRKKGLRC